MVGFRSIIERIHSIIFSFLPFCIQDYIEQRKNKNVTNQRIQDTIEWDKQRLLKYCFKYNRVPESLLKNLRMYIHFIEKGLTMPQPRLFFGIYRLRQIADLVEEIGTEYSSTFEMQYVSKVIKEYVRYHKERRADLPQEHNNVIDRILKVVGNTFDSKEIHQRHYYRNEYFNSVDGSFSQLAKTRHSVRNYLDEPIPNDIFVEIASIAATAPSACNRQPCRIHIVSDKVIIKKIIDLGLGCRGFGELAPSFILVTSDLLCREDVTERHQVGVDAGFFGMNLLYALHEKKIGACVLNWDNVRPNDLDLRKLVPTIRDSETCLFIISCGYTPDEFDIPLGLKIRVNEIIDFV